MSQTRKGHKNARATVSSSQRGKPTVRQRPVDRLECDPQSVRAKGVTKTVRLTSIDFDDRTFLLREHPRPICGSDDLLLNSGVVDCTEGVDPIVLQRVPNSKKNRIVAGWGRLLAMKQSAVSIKAVRCIVLSDVSDEEATIYAARANLQHGRMLSTAEKRRSFGKELEAIAAGGFARPAIAALARAYMISRNTVKAWLRSEDNVSAAHSSSAKQSAGTKAASHAGQRISTAVRDTDNTAGATEPRPRPLSIDTMLADLVAVTRLLADSVATTPVTSEQAVELEKVIASLQQVLAQSDHAEEAA